MVFFLVHSRETEPSYDNPWQKEFSTGYLVAVKAIMHQVKIDSCNVVYYSVMRGRKINKCSSLLCPALLNTAIVRKKNKQRISKCGNDSTFLAVCHVALIKFTSVFPISNHCIVCLKAGKPIRLFINCYP